MSYSLSELPSPLPWWAYVVWFQVKGFATSKQHVYKNRALHSGPDLALIKSADTKSNSTVYYTPQKKCTLEILALQILQDVTLPDSKISIYSNRGN